MNIRKASPEDARDCAKVHVDSWKVAYRGLVPDSVLDNLSYTSRTKFFTEFLSSNPDDNYVAEENDEVVGILTIGGCRDEDLDPQMTGEIWGIYLHPNYWRQGIGSALCEFALDRLSSLGYREVILWVFKDNQSARLFYESLGFQADGASKQLEPGTPLEAIRYRRKILGNVEA